MSQKPEMTPYERLMAAFERRKPDRVPVTPFVREWCVRQAGYKFSEVMTNTEKYVYSQLYSIRKFGYDMVLDLLAVHAESEAMGSKLKIPLDSPPSVDVPAVRDFATDLPKLRVPHPRKDGRLPIILEGTRRLKEAVGGVIPVMGYVQACWRHTCMMRGTERALLDMKKNPEQIKELLDIATDSCIVYGEAVVEAGADLIWVSDPTSSGDMISKKAFEEFVLPFLTRQIKSYKRMGTKVFLHICGNVNDRLEAMASTGCDAISVDEKVDLARAKSLVGGKVCLMGNVSPGVTLLSKTPKEVEEESRVAIEKAMAGGGFVLAPGCIVPAAVPPENIAAMVSAAQKYGVY
ncbi:MAG: uroporphyrinogen decarboxylase family protein [Candidatus Methanomethylicia archaeon]|nr:uroporphyrinogen decarboxylase family protein [Candidatus Methanomethylicia archaeon]